MNNKLTAMNKLSKTNNLTPGFTTHPGEILKDELEARNISQTDFSRQIGYQKSQINEIITGKRGINAELAILLEEVLKIDAEYWMNAQKTFELDAARIAKKNHNRLEAIAQWNMVHEIIPVNYYKKQGVLIGDPVEDVPMVKEIYNVQTFEEIAGIYAKESYRRFRKSDKLSEDKINVIGWVKLVEYKAKQKQAEKFNLKNKSELVAEINNILYKNKKVKEKVEESLKESGIKIIYQEKYEKTPVDGISFWSDHHPTIGMTLRHNRIDNFAFTLFHELGHVFLHLVNDNEAEFIDLTNEEPSHKKTEEEKEANDFALNNLIAKDVWDDFFDNNTYHSDAVIKKFSKKIKIHPAIIRGRLCHEKDNYSGRTSISYEIK